MTFAPRWYQTGSIDALWESLRKGVRAPVACLPTGAGKSVVVSSICRTAVQEWKGRVLVLVHVKELVAQLAEAIQRDWGGPDCPIGILSAGLGSKTINQITVAGIQSAFRKSIEIGPRDIILIDEAHLIPESGEGMYQTLIGELRLLNPKVRIMGVTATPYRMGQGLIYGDGKVFSDIIYDAGIKQLIDDKFLCNLRSKDGGAPDLSGIHMRGGEFISGELETVMSDLDKVNHAADEAMRHGADRKAWLVFCCGVDHARLVSAALAERGIDNAVVTGETPDDERDALIARFKSRELRCLVNVNVLTTGFDAPHVDLVIMLRPTQSAGLYYQQMGRGLRIHPDKNDCLVLDMAGNIQRHGPIDILNQRIMAPKDKRPGGEAPSKRCPECEEVNPTAVRFCTACGYSFPEPALARHDTVADTASPISDGTEEKEPPRRWEKVSMVTYEAWTKKDAAEGAPRTLCVNYYDGMFRVAREWVCVEHAQGSYAFNKACDWLRRRLTNARLEISVDTGEMQIITDDAPALLRAELSATLGNTGRLISPRRVRLEQDGKFSKIIEHDFAEPGDDADEVFVPILADDEEPPF